jgi:hypothetical protein
MKTSQLPRLIFLESKKYAIEITQKILITENMACIYGDNFYVIMAKFLQG